MDTRLGAALDHLRLCDDEVRTKAIQVLMEKSDTATGMRPFSLLDHLPGQNSRNNSATPLWLGLADPRLAGHAAR